MRAPDPGSPCWVDGRRVLPEDATLPASDPAVLAGLGVFETLAVVDGRLLELDEHLKRLYDGAARLGIEPPPLDRVRSDALCAADEGRPALAWLKIVLTGTGRSFVFRGPLDASERGRSVSAILLPWRRSLRDPLQGLKTLNYAGNLLGLEVAKRKGADEGLWLNSRGHLAEGCTSNLFLVDGSRVLTPRPGEGILPGIVRGLALAAARNLGLAVHEGRVKLQKLERAREAFLTSSVRGVRPLVRYGNRPLGGGSPGPTTLKIVEEVANLRRVAPGPG